MPQPRSFGTEISGNARKKPHLTPQERTRIIAKHEAGASLAELATEFSRSKSTIHDTIKRYSLHQTTSDLPRSGRPPRLSSHTKKIIYRKARAASKIEYSELAKEGVVVNADRTTSKPPSRRTLYRVLKGEGLTNHRCKKRPKLNRGHAAKRLQFARQYRQFAWGRRTLKFSDECLVQKGSGANQEWCFRFPWEKWKPEMILEYGTSRKPAQMVWASIWLDERGRARRSNLVIMERDSDAPRGGYSAQSYIEALKKGLLPHYRRSQLFMQDGAGIHRSRAVAAFLQDHHINTIAWPPYSPDLNPIEHLWWALKRRMYKHYPQYNNLSQAEEEWDRFCEALKECWRSIPSKLIKRLIMSMPRRLDACRRARGWQTKY
ncbi:Transposase [Pyrenophora tritici-repentis]|uniref:Transposase n=1 Tax=Pyrenophora tritici-repentis TaxID=45151 RepID=A0A922SZ28_9PLEO|nr:Transposase [Pyrenophora tritici-repentis]KAI1520449.1 Transposase [Pyrenophora tritici-repentis]